MNSNWLLRTEAVLGKNSLEKIKNKTVMIAGLGGVGGYACEALARCGVSSFILIDADVFEETNLNRQLLCLYSNIGKEKTLCAEKRIKSVNPCAIVKTFTQFITEENVISFIEMKPDIVVDAIDSLNSKCALLACCLKNGIPVVSSMGAALRSDTTKVRTADISKTSQDPLAKAVRHNLRAMGIETGIQCVYSCEKSIKTKDGTLGSLVTVVGTFGLTLAQLAINEMIK